MKRRCFILASGGLGAARITQPAANFELQDYDPEVKLTGEFGIFADRYISTEATVLAEEFRRFHPNLKVMVEPSMTGGSIGDGPRMVEGPLYLMGTKIANRELGKLGAKRVLSMPAFGWGVFLVVSEKSPIQSLDLKSLGEAYFGQRTKEVTWSEIGGELGAAKNVAQVVLHGMGDLSRFTLLFRSLLGTDQKLAPIVTRHRGVQDLLQAVERSEGALGFCGHGSKKVRLLALSKDRGDSPIPPPNRVSLGAEYQYPLMSVAMAYSPIVSRDSAHTEFCKFLISKEGVHTMKSLEFVIPISDEDYGNVRRNLEGQLEGGN